MSEKKVYATNHVEDEILKALPRYRESAISTQSVCDKVNPKRSHDYISQCLARLFKAGKIAKVTNSKKDVRFYIEKKAIPLSQVPQVPWMIKPAPYKHNPYAV